ncbi:MAG: carbohydrate kinase [candidate division KSB1 bacterium]|nr:carbohydrate kinase [candidate division KSB1 bacterium]
MSSFHVAGLGEVLWDVYPEGRYPGGAPANFCAHVAQYGMNSCLISRVGRDQAGEELISKVEKMSVETEPVQVDDVYPTGTVNVTLNADGVPSFTCTRDVAFDHLRWDDSLKTLATRLHGVLFGTLAQRNPVSRRTIQRCLEEMDAAVKLFDVNIRGWDNTVKETVLQSLHLCDCVKMNDDELMTLKTALGASAQNDIDFLDDFIHKFNLKLAAVTRGGDGCLLMTADDQIEHPGFRVNVVDTTGSGDAFAAGLMISMLERRSLADTAEFSNRLGAFVATRRGAVPAWALEELESYE